MDIIDQDQIERAKADRKAELFRNTATSIIMAENIKNGKEPHDFTSDDVNAMMIDLDRRR